MTKKISGKSGLVPALEQACQVLIRIGASNGKQLNLTEICQSIGIHPSKGHNILKTLAYFGFVDKDTATKTYSLGMGLGFLARSMLKKIDYEKIAGPYLRELAQYTSATTFLGLFSGDQFFVVAKDDADLDFTLNIQVGRRFPHTLGSHGKIMAAYMPEKELQGILAEPNLRFYGSLEKTAQQLNTLSEELAQCREKGFALDPGDVQEGVLAIAAPVFGLEHKTLGALVTIGTYSKDKVSLYGPKIAQAAKELSQKMGGSSE